MNPRDYQMTVLVCGGHADGRWVEVTKGETELEISTPRGFRWDTQEKVEIERQRYRIWPINILGYGMYVASLNGCRPETNDVLRTIVQRDVFKHLTGERP